VNKMKVYWLYQCDYGHSWILFRDEQELERSEDKICSFGHEAVTLRKRKPVDEVKIIIQPAGYVSDPVKNQVVFQNKYRLVISNLDGTEERVSVQVYSWKELLDLIEKIHIRAKSTEEAWRLWDQIKP